MAQDHQEVLETFIHGILADHVNTHLEGRIVAYNAGRVDVMPIGKKNYTDGDSLDFPLLKDLPLCWPSSDGGRCGFKTPVKVGDACYILFDQLPQDADSNDPDQVRRFSLADARVIPYAFTGDAIPGNDNVTMFYDKASIQITPAGKVRIIAPGGFEVLSPSVNYSVDGTAATATTFKGRVVMDAATINGRDFMGHTHKEQGDGNNVSGVI